MISYIVSRESTDLSQADLAPLDEINEAARSRDENVATTLDDRHLERRRNPAVRHARVHLS